MEYVGPASKDPNFEIYTITAEPAEMEALEKQANERNMALNDYVVYLLELALKLENIKKNKGAYQW